MEVRIMLEGIVRVNEFFIKKQHKKYIVYNIINKSISDYDCDSLTVLLNDILSKTVLKRNIEIEINPILIPKIFREVYT